MIGEIDLSTPEGGRNKAILETLYSCGLRVSEVVNLKLSQLYFDVGFIRVVGKGNKERLVPIGSSAIKYVNIYRQAYSRASAGTKRRRRHSFFQPAWQATDPRDDLFNYKRPG